MRASGPIPLRGRPSKFDARRLELLGQAAAIFAEAGYCGATMHELAARLRVTRPALYHYAPSKDALFEQCAAVAEDALNGAVVAALAQPSGRAQVNAFFEHYAEASAGDFGRCFVAADLRALPSGVRNMISAARERLKCAVRSMIERGVADGSMCDCQPVLVSTLLFAAFDEVCARRPAVDSDARAAVVSAILALFFKGLAPLAATRSETRMATYAAPH